MEKRIYLSNTDKKIGGVCAGIAEYLNIDPTIVRLITVLLIFLDGLGLVAYIIAWLLMPKKSSHQN